MDRQVVVTLLEDNTDNGSVNSRGCVKQLKKCGWYSIVGGILLLLGLGVGYRIGTSRSINMNSGGGPLSLALTGNNFTDVQTRINEILRYLGYLEGAGLDFYLRVSNSSCPQEVCRQCTKKLYKDSHPYVPPARVCSDYHRVKNASCLLCEVRRQGQTCYTFQEILNGHAYCGHEPTCCEKSYMADLNNYCHGGNAVCNDDEELFCNCPHGREGGRCDKEEDTENVLCDCFNKRINLLERLKEFKVKDCNSVYYSDNITCTNSSEEENCFCKAQHDTDSDSDINSCDTPVTHNPVTEGTPITHNPVTEGTPVTHNPVKRRTPVPHNPMTGRQAINEAEKPQSHNLVFFMGISLVTNTLLDT